MLYVCQCNPRYFWTNFNKNVLLEICEAPGNLNNNPNLPAGLQVNILKLCVCNRIAGSSDCIYSKFKKSKLPWCYLVTSDSLLPIFFICIEYVLGAICIIMMAAAKTIWRKIINYGSSNMILPKKTLGWKTSFSVRIFFFSMKTNIFLCLIKRYTNSYYSDSDTIAMNLYLHICDKLSNQFTELLSRSI